MKKGRDIKKDKSIKAKKAGKRVSEKGHKNQYGTTKGGNVYFESRKDHADKDLRKKLAKGGITGGINIVDGVAVIKKGNKIIAKVYDRPVYYKIHNIKSSFDEKLPYSLEIKNLGQRDCESLSECQYYIDKYVMAKGGKIEKVMHEFKEGELKSHGKTVTNPKQAIAIGLSEQRAAEKHPYKYAKGGNLDNPRVYVVSLYDYNNASPFNYGKWFDLTDYADGETLMEAIHEFLNEIRDEHGGEKREEWAVHDYENFPSHYYHESMNEDSFNDVYDFIDLVQRTGIPAEAIEGYVDYGHDISGVEDAYYGTFDNEEAFAEEFVDSLGGIENISNPEYYVYVTDTDRRIIAGEEADNARERAEEDGEEFSDEDYDAVYDEWYEGLNDPYYFLVNEQGLYSGEDLLKSNFVRFDYEKFARDLLINDYFDVNAKDGGIYVFSRH